MNDINKFADGFAKLLDDNPGVECKQYWVVVFNNGKSITSSKESKEDAEMFISELQNDNPGLFDDAYSAPACVLEVNKT